LALFTFHTPQHPVHTPPILQKTKAHKRKRAQKTKVLQKTKEKRKKTEETYSTIKENPRRAEGRGPLASAGIF
jgi:hypothetical protein